MKDTAPGSISNIHSDEFSKVSFSSSKYCSESFSTSSSFLYSWGYVLILLYRYRKGHFLFLFLVSGTKLKLINQNAVGRGTIINFLTSPSTVFVYLCSFDQEKNKEFSYEHGLRNLASSHSGYYLPSEVVKLHDNHRYRKTKVSGLLLIDLL